MTTHRRALRLAAGLVAAGLALTAAPYALAADGTGSGGAIRLTDQQAATLADRLDGDVYPQATAPQGSGSGAGTDAATPAPATGAQPDAHAPVTFTAGSTLEGVRGLGVTVPAGSDGSYFTVHSLGNVQLHAADGTTRWARTNTSLYADWQAKPLRPWDTEPYPARIPMAFNPVTPFGGDAAQGYDTADLTGDGVPDIVIAAAAGGNPYRPFTSPGSSLSYGSFVTVLDGATGTTLWSKLYASAPLVRFVDGTLLIADSPRNNTGAPATATATLTGIRFAWSEGELKPARTWTYDTHETGAAAWGDLLDLGGGKAAVSFDRRRTATAPGRGTTLVIDTADGTPDWQTETPLYDRQLHLDAGRDRLLAIEQSDYNDGVSYAVVSYGLADGARTVLDTRVNALPTAATVGDLGQGADYAVAESTLDADQYINSSTVRVLSGADGSTVRWTSTTKRPTASGDGPSTWQLDITGGALLASAQDGRDVDTADNVSGLRYGKLTSYNAKGKVRWSTDGTSASPRLQQVDAAAGLVRTVDQQQNVRTYKLTNGSQKSLTALQGDLDYAAAADLDGDGKQDVVAGGSSDGVWAYSGPSLLTGTPKKLWQAAVPGEVHAVATGDVNGDGKPDVVVAADTATVVLNGRTGKVLATLPGGATFTRSVTVADLDGDGRAEILVPTDALRAYRGDGTPLWTYAAPAGSGAVVFSDAVVSDGRVHAQYSAVGAMQQSDSVQNGVALDAAKGTLLWQADPKAPAEAVDGKLHGALLDHAVFASPKIPYADGHAVVYTWVITAVPGGVDGGTDLVSPMSVTEIRDGRTGEVLHQIVAGGPWSHGNFFTGADNDGLQEMGFGVLRQYLANGDDRWTSTIAPLRTAQFITGPDGRKLLVGGVEGGLAAYDPAIVGDGNAFHSSIGSATARGGRDYLAVDLDGDGREEMISLNSDALGVNRAAALLGGGVLSIDNGIHQMTTYKLS